MSVQTEMKKPADVEPAGERSADSKRRVALRRKTQLALWLIVVLVIVGGLWWPLLGFVVPIVMLTGIIGGFFKGRYVCGWLCPRGAFLERIVGRISPERPIPMWLGGRPFGGRCSRR